MAGRNVGAVLGPIRGLFAEGAAASLEDEPLLRRYAARGQGSAEAFEALVARHGPAVLSACRGVVRDPNDAEDVFQATFLILARKAGVIRLGRRDALGGWLHRVARRVAVRAEVEAARRRARERRAVGARPEAVGMTEAIDEAGTIVAAEVDRLPGRFRAPVVLCYVDGLTRAEAAARLGCGEATVRRRLADARVRLRAALSRRGIAPALPVAAHAVPESWARAAVEAATAVGRSAAPTSAARLAGSALGSLAWARLRWAAAAALAASAIGWASAAVGPRPPAPPPEPIPPRVEALTPQAPRGDEDSEGNDVFEGLVLDPDGNPKDGARVYLAGDLWNGDRARTAEVRALTGPDGRFLFRAPDVAPVAADRLPRRRRATVLATAEGLAPDWTRTPGAALSIQRIPGEHFQRGEITLKLVRDTPVLGRVVDPAGHPVAGATVRPIELSDPGDGLLDRHLAQLVRYNAGNGWDGGSLRTLSPWEVRIGELTRATTTDGDGRFELTGFGRDRIISLDIAAPSFATTQFFVMTRVAPDVQGIPVGDRRPILVYGARPVIALSPGRVVRAVVRDRETGAPIPGVLAGLIGSGVLEHRQVGGESAITDGEGRCRFVMPADQTRETEFLAVPPPGSAYFMGLGFATPPDKQEDVEVEIRCIRGIPFRARIVDATTGEPYAGEVTYDVVHPNPHADAAFKWGNVNNGRLCRAVRGPDEIYSGIAMPGPGVILAARRPGERPAFIDPKATFAPGRMNWSRRDRHMTYGDQDVITDGWVSLLQIDYAAIIPINPAPGSGPLELSATIVRDRPRTLHLVDPEGAPLAGVRAVGLSPDTMAHYYPEQMLRTADVTISGLHPDRVRTVRFYHEARRLMAVLAARGDRDSDYTVTLRPWAAISGRLLDEVGLPLTQEDEHRGPLSLSWPHDTPESAHVDDPARSFLGSTNLGKDGRFTIDHLLPGLIYHAAVYDSPRDRWRGVAFRDVVPDIGEVRDLGDIRVGPLKPIRPDVVKPPS